MTKKVNISKRKIKVALVGCGRIIRNHIKSLILHNSESEIVAICDENLDNLKKTRDFIEEQLLEANLSTIKLSLFSDYAELISAKKKLNIDLIVLATPSGLHASQTIIAAKAGINVCTEKPMATKWEDGIEMVDACERAGVKLFVVKQNRFNATLKLVKKQIEDGRFGRLSLVTTNVFWQRPQTYYDQDKWRGTLDMDGGALMNQASHYVDLLDWLIGPVESLSASVSTISRNIEAEDTAAIQLKWCNGALGTMAVTMLTYPKNLEEGSMTILGEKGTVKIGGLAVNKIQNWEFADYSKDDDLIEKVSYDTTSVYGFGHSLYYKNMLASLNGEDVSICDNINL